VARSSSARSSHGSVIRKRSASGHVKVSRPLVVRGTTAKSRTLQRIRDQLGELPITIGNENRRPITLRQAAESASPIDGCDEVSSSTARVLRPRRVTKFHDAAQRWVQHGRKTEVRTHGNV
jgi:hypothetical protein